MRRILLWLFCIVFAHSVAIAQTEYNYRFWFDDDYENLQTLTSGGNLKTEIDVSGLSESVHSLHVQVVEADTCESSTHTTYFLKIKPQASLRDARYLCYIDGVKHSEKNYAVIEGTDNFLLDLSDVSPGVHCLTFYLALPDGTVSTIKSAYFIREIVSENSKLKCIYKVDDDETVQEAGEFGFGEWLIELDAAKYSCGLHSVCYFFVTENGDVSNIRTSHFMRALEEGQGIIRYEYSINDDDFSETVTLDTPVDTLRLKELQLPERLANADVKNFRLKAYDANGGEVEAEVSGFIPDDLFYWQPVEIDYSDTWLTMNQPEAIYNLLINGNAEDTSTLSFVSQNYDVEGKPERIETEDGFIWRIRSISRIENQWDSQFRINPGKTFRKGEVVDISFRYKSKYPAQVHAIPQSEFGKDLSGSNTLYFTEEWQQFHLRKLIDEELDGMSFLCLHLNVFEDANEYYFDDISWKQIPCGNMVNNGDAETDDASCFVSKTGTVAENTDIRPCSRVQTDKGYSWKIDVPKVDDDADHWWNQFWIVSPQSFNTGDTVYVSFQYKAERDAEVFTEAHASPSTYLTWGLLGTLNFSTEWQTYAGSIVLNYEQDGFQSIAFDLSAEKFANTYYFDNVELYSSVYSPPTATIHYTTDGTEPTEESPVYEEPFMITEPCTVKAAAFGENKNKSETREYDIVRCPSPRFEYDNKSKLTITCEVEDAELYYRYETSGVFSKYSVPLTLKDNRKIYAASKSSHTLDSDTVSFTPDNFRCEPVEFAFNEPWLSMACQTKGTTIRYRIANGYEAVYNEPLRITETSTVYAWAEKEFFNNSDTVSYNVEIGAQEFLYDGLWYRIRSFDDRTCELIPSLDDNYWGDMRIPSVARRFDEDWLVTAIADCAFTDCLHVTSIQIPESIIAIGTRALLTGNLNMLLFARQSSAVIVREAGFSGNLIVDGHIDRLTLQEGYDFSCPEPFTAKKISYDREFRQHTGLGYSEGWETLTLPFDVQTVYHRDKQTEIHPIVSGETSSLPGFWLRAFTADGFMPAGEIRANTPYIISMPNNEEYVEAARLPGRVSFRAVNATVPVSTMESSFAGGRMFVPATTAVPQSESVFVLNSGEPFEGHPSGSVFVSALRGVRPFEAYLSAENSARILSIGELLGDASGIQDVTADDEGRLTICNLNGVLLKRISAAQLPEAMSSLPKGVYIINNKKVLVK